MLVDLPQDIQHHVFDMYKIGLQERHKRTKDLLRKSCGESADTVIDYMSDIVQKPCSKPHYALVLTGPFARKIANIIRFAAEEKWLEADKFLLLGRFNGALRDKKLLIIEDEGAEEVKHRIKEIVSSRSLVIEERRRNATRVPSYHRVVIISTRPIFDGARRFCNVECNNVEGWNSA